MNFGPSRTKGAARVGCSYCRGVRKAREVRLYDGSFERIGKCLF